MSDLIIEISKDYYNKFHKIPFEGEIYHYNNKYYINGSFLGNVIYRILFNSYNDDKEDIELKKQIMDIFNISQDELNILKELNDFIYTLKPEQYKYLIEKYNDDIKQNEITDKYINIIKDLDINKYSSKIFNLKCGIIDGDDKQIINALKELIFNPKYDKTQFYVYDMTNNYPFEYIQYDIIINHISIKKVLKNVYFYGYHKKIKNEIDKLLQENLKNIYYDLNDYKKDYKEYFL